MFNVGDIVRIIKNPPKDWISGLGWESQMSRYCGDLVVIRGKTATSGGAWYRIQTIDGLPLPFAWGPAYFEKSEEYLDGESFSVPPKKCVRALFERK